MMNIVSIHVPKAGGTSMLELWRRTVGSALVLMDYSEPPGDLCADFAIDPDGWATRRPLALPDGIQVVHGHFRPEKYDLLKNAFRLTMLRHPVDNVISIYCYWKRIPLQPNAVHKYFLANRLDILGFAKLPMIRYLYSQTYFGGWDVDRLDFVGRHENRVEDLARLATILDMEIDGSIHLNATVPEGEDAERETMRANSQLLNELAGVLEDDIRFYENLLA